MGGKMLTSHGSTLSRGVMILFKPNLNMLSGINNVIQDKNGR